jgi:antitoxin (DNA-binding transcriptional repressor) of toxin-antitoxin stability system
MCYVATPKAREAQVGVRELRQNLSVYLARLSTGTVFRVTDRGRAVAMLIPLPQHNTTVERLVAAGRARPATRDLLALGRPRGRTSTALTRALQQVRDDRL